MTTFSAHWHELRAFLMVPPWRPSLDESHDTAPIAAWLLWLIGWLVTVLGSVSTRLCASLVGTTWHLVPLFLSTRILGAGMLGGVIWYRFFLVVIALVLTLQDTSPQESAVWDAFLVICYSLLVLAPLTVASLLLLALLAQQAVYPVAVGEGLFAVILLPGGIAPRKRWRRAARGCTLFRRGPS